MTTRHASWMAIVVAAAYGAAIGCEDDASSGASSPSTSGSASAGGAGVTGGTGGGGSGGDVSATGGTSADPCGNLCTKFDELGCRLYGCESSCAEWIQYSGDCAPQMAAEIDCIADNTTQCGQDVCHAEFAALDACAGGVDCFAHSCKGNSRGMTDTCECSRGCSTGAIQQVCTTIGTEPTECECRKGGRVVGRCTQDFSYCDLWSGCCDRFF
jgi:hypothetical protein